MICVNYNFKLKFVGGELNETFNENEKIVINKFSNNIDALYKFHKESNVKQEQLKKDIDEHFVNVKKNNVFREFIVKYIK